MQKFQAQFSRLEREQPSVPNRLFLLDLLKAISITAVVSYHAVWVPASTYAPHEMWVEVLFAPLRFCVPILFTISFLLSEYGFLHRPDQSPLRWLKKRLIRLAIPAAFWFSIPASLKLATSDPPEQVIGQLLTGEIFTGAYYLLVLFQLTVLFFWLRSWLIRPHYSFCAIAAQGLIILLIHAALLGLFGATIIPVLRQIDRPLLLYWFGYIALGIVLCHSLPVITRRSRQLSGFTKIGLLGVTGLTLMAESLWLWKVTGEHIPPFDYVMVSCLASIPVLFLIFASVKESQLPSVLSRIITLLSQYSLGIFCINGFVSKIFLSLGSHWFDQAVFSLPEILLIKCVSWFLLLGLSLGISMGIARLGLKSMVC